MARHSKRCMLYHRPLRQALIAPTIPSVPRPRSTRLPYSFLAACLLFCSAAWANTDIELPDFGEPADRTLSPAQEAELGRDFMARLHKSGLLLADQEVTDYVRTLGRRLAGSGGFSPQRFTFFVMRDTRINAFALPGGYVGINAGLILASSGESELAGVVSHEIAHVTQRHIARQLDATKNLNYATMAAVLLAIIAGGGNPEVIDAALAIGLSSTVQRQINYTRTHELEADRLGIRTLASAGFDPAGMASFFERLESQSKLYGEGPPELLRTHPVNITRIAEAKNRAREFKALGAPDDTEYRLMRARLRVLTARRAADALAHFEGHLQNDRRLEDRYGLALANHRNGRLDRAAEMLEVLISERPRNMHFRMALADVLLDQNQRELALTQFDAARKLNPSYLPLAHAYANALIQARQPARARQIIVETPGALDTENPDMQRLMAMAARDIGQPAEAHFRMAEFHRLTGDYESAIHQLRAALRDKSIDGNDRSRLEALLEKYRREAPEEVRRAMR